MIKNNTNKGFQQAFNGDGINICGRMQMQRGNVQKNSSQTLTCKGGEDVGVVVEEDEQESNETS